MEEVFAKNNIETLSIEYWGLFMIPIAIVRKILLTFVPEGKVISRGFAPPGALATGS